MKRVLLASVLLIATGYAQSTDEALSPGGEPYFVQVSGHCYVLPVEENGENIAVVATKQGTLLFDPPPEPDLSILIESLKTLNAAPVRWMINTGSYFLQTDGLEYFSELDAVLLAGFRQYAPAAHPEPPGADPVAGHGRGLRGDSGPDGISPSGWGESSPAYPDTIRIESPVYPRFVFKERMYLYPEDLEIRIRALPHAARTEADIFAYVPAEKVLFAGRLFEPSYYPDIDVSAGGSALKWIDALEEVIDSVPLLISAIPPDEPEEEEEGAESEPGFMEGEDAAISRKGGPAGDESQEEEEITLEEMIAVIPARGEVSNLLMMKELLDTAGKLRNGISRALKSGRSCEQYLDSPASYPYQTYGNFYPFAAQLCKELSPPPNGESM
ncbi:MAG: hypothetical protein JW793_09490 [Acidobacteria bacterium]|nr:hypothetical protein [Acidobacteriota bacterium]